ncbi:hypothetical protein HanXRQr2_Chr16g0746851 [Helianthus annuus]|uniref:Uncharacterized protein n=1 Tax=Helianthus annuus TaxID=4232 RepID=A0A9K3DRU8_HELAN|nr:hypothetical protein HanXRQr2_Chr16g0746851 [Helianthus annuus]
MSTPFPSTPLIWFDKLKFELSNSAEMLQICFHGSGIDILARISRTLACYKSPK